jgi:hypothetical protein
LNCIDQTQFANAINKTAYFIQREIGRSSMFETVLFMGQPDVRHFILFVALYVLITIERDQVLESTRGLTVSERAAE